MASDTQPLQQEQIQPAITAKPAISFKPILETIGIIIFFSWLGVLIAILSSYK